MSCPYQSPGALQVSELPIDKLTRNTRNFGMCLQKKNVIRERPLSETKPQKGDEQNLDYDEIFIHDADSLQINLLNRLVYICCFQPFVWCVSHCDNGCFMQGLNASASTFSLSCIVHNIHILHNIHQNFANKPWI